jgi:hypothetical protein
MRAVSFVRRVQSIRRSNLWLTLFVVCSFYALRGQGYGQTTYDGLSGRPLFANALSRRKPADSRRARSRRSPEWGVAKRAMKAKDPRRLRGTLDNLSHPDVLAMIALTAKDPVARLKSVERLNHAEALFRVVLETEDAKVREVAVEKLTRPENIAGIALRGAGPHNSKLDSVRFVTQESLAKLIFEDENIALCQVAVARLTDQNILADIVSQHKELDIRKKAVARLTDKASIVKLVTDPNDESVRLSALQRLAVLTSPSVFDDNQQEGNWDEARAAATIKAYEKCLSMHPEGVFVIQVRSFIEALQCELTDWQVAKNRDTILSYTYFLEQHPASRFVSKAEARIVDHEVTQIMAGEHGELPPLNRYSSSRGKAYSVINIHNETEYTLTVRFSGTESFRVSFHPHGIGSIEALQGNYRVTASVNATHVTPYAGNQRLDGSNFETRYYIVSTGGNRNHPFSTLPSIPSIPSPTFPPMGSMRGPSQRSPFAPWPNMRKVPDHLKRGKRSNQPRP